MAQHLGTRSLAILIPGALLAAALAACGGPTPAAQPTAAPTVQPTTAPAAQATPQPTTAPAATTPLPTAAPAGLAPEELKQRAQATVDLYARAFASGDAELLRQAVDQRNPPFRRLVETRFRYGLGRLRDGAIVQRVTSRGDLFIAHIRAGEIAYDWPMRLEGDRLVITEPTEAELGKRQTTQSENFTYYTYPWADDVNREIERLMEQARDTVKAKLGKLPSEKALVYVMPSYGLQPGGSPNAAAYYDRGSRAGLPPRIYIYTPGTYLFGGYKADDGWQADLLPTLTHEYTHLVNDKAFVPIARMTDWMSEGLAEYVAQGDKTDAYWGVPEAVRADRWLPIKDTENPLNPRDLTNFYANEDSSFKPLAYGYAASLVRYIVERYGGIDSFWTLVRAYDKEQDYDRAFQQAFGVSFAQFEQEWRAWLKNQYG